MTNGKGKLYNGVPSSLDKRFRHLLLYARISILAMLNYYGKNGISYQDIKDALKLQDGSLGPNIAWMKQRGYIKSNEERVNGKSAVVYYITEAGQEAYREIKMWLEGILVNPGATEEH